MLTNRGQIHFSILPSPEPSSIEHHLGEDDPDTDSCHSKTATPLVSKRHFQFYRQAIADIRQSPVSLRLWLLSTLFFAAVKIVIARLSGFGSAYEYYCSVDGSFQTEGDIDFWAISDFFQVNIATGNLTFTQAKVIDTTWDLIVGRGGQAILSLITWKVFTNYVAMSMTIQPVTFATYRILFADSGPSISSTTSLLHDFIRFKGLASKSAGAFLIYSILLSLALPTLVSSATGYTSLNEGFIRAYDNNLVPISSFNQLDTSILNSPWLYSNETYTQDEIKQRGVCVPVKDRYQWGGSFLQIFLLHILLALWTIGCLTLMLSSHAHYRVTKDTEAPKGYQALGILVGNIDDQLTESTVKVCTTTDQQLKATIKTTLAGGSMSFDAQDQIKTFQQWFAKERIWFICLCVWVVSALAFLISEFLFSIFFFGFLFIIVFYLSLGTLFAIIIGQTLGSRLFLILCWLLLCGGNIAGWFFIPI
ncbi:hypothetical protein F5Y09DRAFT_294779 [Xylaria sp. FL1042]|nr:hypothetical protein F5Y09DRAFT_294779 [Xylaria sp. FL1042]